VTWRSGARWSDGRGQPKFMNIYYDKRFEKEVSGFHPYKGGAYSPDVQYYDFKAYPELISTVLEDYVEWSDCKAIQTFYDLLRWLNGPDSLLESSDCAFGEPSRRQTKTTKRLWLLAAGC